MKTGELAVRIAAFTDNVDAESASTRQRLRRIVQDIQEKYDEVWNHRGWRFSMGTASIVVAGGTRIGLLPSDFATLPRFGGVFVDGQRLRNIADATMRDINQGLLPLSNIGYILGGHSVADGRATIEFDVQGPLTATMYYKRKAPLLAPKPYAPSVAAGGAGNVNGSVKYLVVYTTSDGLSHEAGTPVTFVAVNTQTTVTLPDPGPIGEHNVVSMNLYRTTAGGSAYFKVNATPLIVGTDTVFLDNNVDGTLVLLPPLVEYNHLAQIPENYHTTVLLPGVRAMRKQSQGDTRDFERAYTRGLAEMVREERPFQSEVQQMPRWTPYPQNW